MGKILEKWREWRIERKKDQKVREGERLERMASDRLQVREFENSLYICLDDVPLLSEHTLTLDGSSLLNILSSMREEMVYYYLHQYLERHDMQYL